MDNNTQTPAEISSLAAPLMSHLLAYGFLNKVFYLSPEEPFIQALADDKLFDEWPLSADNEQTQIGLQLLQTFLDSWHSTQLADLQRDYARLFIGPDRLLAPPWESVYLSREHLLFEEQTLAVRNFYGRFNLQAPNLNSEPDDHIGLELAFMAHLCTLGLTAVAQNDVAAVETSLQALRDFLAQHLLRWAPQFCQKVIEQAQTDYFRGVGYLTLGCLQTAAARLEMTELLGTAA